MTVLLPPVSALVAARAYLMDELDSRDNPLKVGITPPAGNPTSYALLSRTGGAVRVFIADYMIRLRVFDADAVRLESNADLLHRLMLAAVHRKIETVEGSVWVSAARSQMGPSSLDDPAVPLFGMQSAVFWSIGLRSET